jgi:F0F1-type ATP synthase epsilon subunit
MEVYIGKIGTAEEVKFSQVSSLRALLSNGWVEILENHQDLLGVLGNGAVIVTTQEGKKNYVMQDGALVVCQKFETGSTSKAISIFAERFLEINSSLSESFVQEEIQKARSRAKELEENGSISPKSFLASKEIIYWENVKKALTKGVEGF